MGSIFIVTYGDIIAEQKRYIVHLKRNREALRVQGILMFDAIDRRILVNERILSLLEKSKRDTQADLWQENVDINTKK